MSSTHPWPRQKSVRERAAALIIVLAFVVLLTGLTFAYFSRSATDRQLSRASYNDAAADMLARSALDIVVGDFRQEIINGSTSPAPIVAGIPIYKPTANANMVPVHSGVPTGNPTPYNLVRISSNSSLPPAPGITTRASNVNSTVASVNKRSVTPARWNSHFLLPLKTAGSTTDSTPANFNPPDWVLMTRNGPVAFSNWDSTVADRTSNNYVIGRYAYAVYDEGGLLDINVAGYPLANGGISPSVVDIGRKGVTTFADLTSLPTTGTNTVTPAAANKFILFRNYATTDSSQNLGNSNYFTSLCSNLAGKGFINYYLGGNDLAACTLSPQKGTIVDFGQVNPVTSSASGAFRTDQSFVTRQELIRFVNYTPKIAAPDTLQYIGTFSREPNKPSWPLVQSTTLLFPARFYMANVADVVPNPSNSSGVLSNFGLHWNAAGYWEYWGEGGSGIASAIPALPKDPNGVVCMPGNSACTKYAGFFQLLNYALHPTWDTTTSDSADVATTLALGAAIIDQYDDATAKTPSGSTTTRIDYSGGTAYGMEATDSFRPTAAPSPPSGYYSLDRPFRNVGDLGYAFKQGSINASQTIDFLTASNPDAGVLDFFTYNCAGALNSVGAPTTSRSGTVNLNTKQSRELAAVLKGAITAEPSTIVSNNSDALTAATAIAGESATTPAISRFDVARLTSKVTNSPFTGGDQAKETVSRALAEVGQTRTWGLLIDVVAQTGHYVPTATKLENFVVDGEKRYWLHVAIDRFDRTILGQQLEEVFEQ